MRTIHVTMPTRLSPERLLAAAVDFSPRREAIFPAVSLQHMQVHTHRDTSADVTEGTPAGIGINWERCRYDWSEPRSVKAIVTNSNLYQPATTRWELRATGRADGGSTVEMTWVLDFKSNTRGIIFGALFTLAGKPMLTRQAKRTLRNIESLESDDEA